MIFLITFISADAILESGVILLTIAPLFLSYFFSSFEKIEKNYKNYKKIDIGYVNNILISELDQQITIFFILIIIAILLSFFIPFITNSIYALIPAYIFYSAGLIYLFFTFYYLSYLPI